MRSRARFFVVALGATLAAAAACRRMVDEKPVASLASTPESEARFANLRLRWAAATPAERAAMRPELSQLQAWLESRGDGLEATARAYLAVAWLDANVPSAAEAIARPLYDGPPGVTHDLGILVRGIAQRRQGHPDAAIETLRPIVGKLIDPFARPLLYEEMVQALIDEQRYDEAIVFAEAWLRAGDLGDRKALHAEIARVLQRVPADAARRAIEAQRTSKGTAGYSPEMMLILGDRIDQGDEEGYASGGIFVDADAGVADAKIPTIALPGDASSPLATPALPIRFDPKTIALLVPSSAAGFGEVSTETTRAATAAVTPTTGLADAKKDAGVYGSESGVAPPAATSHLLAVFDTGGTVLGTAKALDAAERDGAAIVLGGVIEADANALAALAQSRHVPAVLFRAPTVPPAIAPNDKRWYVVLGPSTDDEASLTLGTTTASAQRAIVDATPEPGAPAASDDDPMHVRCDATPKSADATSFPVALWHQKKVATIVVLGDMHCARHVVSELIREKSYQPHLVLAPSALALLHATLPFARSAICAGQLPADDDAPLPLQALWADQKGPVGFFGALGHDAAMLAMFATPGDILPSVDLTAIQNARALTRDRLFSGKMLSFWSTEQTSVPSSGVVGRKWLTRQVGAGGAWRPAWLAEP